MTDELKKAAEQAYLRAQILQRPEKQVTQQELNSLSSNWQNKETPRLQRTVVDIELEALRKGIPNAVHVSLIKLLEKIPLQSFTFLDAACASGYYYEVIRTLDPRAVEYHGSDYSESMVQAARSYYPEIHFDVQDLTKLTYADRSFDVVMASGVLEHIPDWETAIAEICRVSRRYVIQHRCPLTTGIHHDFTIGTQYNIETPRIFFAKTELMNEFKKHGYHLLKEIDVYGKPAFSQRARSFAKRLLGRKEAESRMTKSFLLAREAQ